MPAFEKDKKKEVRKIKKQKPQKRAVASNVVCGCGCISPFSQKK